MIADGILKDNLFLSISVVVTTFYMFRPGFGGRRCDECEANFYGDPRVECIPCNCNALGLVDPER